MYTRMQNFTLNRLRSSMEKTIMVKENLHLTVLFMLIKWPLRWLIGVLKCDFYYILDNLLSMNWYINTSKNSIFFLPKVGPIYKDHIFMASFDGMHILGMSATTWRTRTYRSSSPISPHLHGQSKSVSVSSASHEYLIICITSHGIWLLFFRDWKSTGKQEKKNLYWVGQKVRLVFSVQWL